MTGTSFALAATQFHDATSLVAVWILCTGLSALAVIDVRTYRLPRCIIHTVGLLGSPLLIVSALVAEDGSRIVSALFGAVGATAVMGALYRLSRGGLGDGDVRLSSLLGLYLGWLGPSAVLIGFTLAFVFGAFVGVVVMILGHGGRRTAIPFGPFLAAGALTVLLIPSVVTQPWIGI